jgi:hypothetical protein
MYLFSQRFVVHGDPRAAKAWAGELTRYVSHQTDMPGSLWEARAGAAVGTMSFTAFVASHAELHAAVERLQADPEYHDMAAAGQEHLVGRPENSLIEVVHTAGADYKRAELGSLASVISAEISVGRYSRAFGWGIEMAELVTEITGQPTIFARNVAGSFGGVSWIGASPDVATFDALEERLNKDPRYLAKLDEIAGLFVEGSGNRVIGTRIA